MDGGVLAHYLDELKREKVYNVWKPVTGNRLFWSQVLEVLRSNDPDDGRNLWAKEWHYKEDGRLWIREDDLRTRRVIDENLVVDVSDRYEPHPALGDFEGLYRLIRRGPPELVPAWEGNFVLVEPEPKPKKPRRNRAAK